MDKELYTEEELKELQRKEALSGSEEYDIDESTYTSAPLTRQYVGEERFGTQAEFVDIDDSDSNEDIILVDDDPEIIAIESDEPKEEKTSKDDTYTRHDVVASEKEEQRVNEVKKVEKSVRPKKKTAEKGSKTVSFTIPKWALYIVLIVLTFMVCVVMYFMIINHVSDQQKLSEDKEEYIRLVNQINEISIKENEICQEFVALTENFVLEVISIDDYRNNLELLSQKIDEQVIELGKIPAANNSHSNVKAAMIDYVKNTRSIIQNAKGDSMTSDDIKLYVLTSLNQQLSSRNTRHQNIVLLVCEQCKECGIEVSRNNNIIMMDVQV